MSTAGFRRFTRWAAGLAGRTGALGSIVAAMGCAMCFPALASIGAALGLGFLARWEGVLINTLLPAFAGMALAANALGVTVHGQWRRGVAGVAGPALVLLSLYPWWTHDWSTWTFYAGLGLMLVVAAWDLWAPAHRRCETDASRPLGRAGES